MSKAMDDVVAERSRQIEVEGWDAAHDDAHKPGDLVQAAVAYASHAAVGCQVPGHSAHTYQACPPPRYWPWARVWWKPKDPRRDLVRAAALIVAEIDRLDRCSPIRASGARPTGSKPDEPPPNCAAGSVGRDDVGGAA